MKKQMITILMIVLIPNFMAIYCYSTKRQKEINNNHTMTQSLIISETKEEIHYLGNIYRDDRKNNMSLPFIGENDFFIRFNIYRRSKIKNAGGNSGYTMHVIPDGATYKTKLRCDGDSFYFDNEEGHSHPTGEWSDCDELCSKVLEYYFANQSIIPLYTTSENVDISRWKPLFAISVRGDYQQHVLKMTKQELPNGEFQIDCEMLHVNNTLVNGEIINFNISTHSLHFTFIEGEWILGYSPDDNFTTPKLQYMPIEGGTYQVRTRINSSKTTYTNEKGEIVTEDLTVPGDGRFGEQHYLGDFENKVLEYYLANKDKIEITKDFKP
jgi:hypothetical protein